MRFPDWRERLEAELRLARVRSFRYGSWDCVHFAARCIDAMTGSRWSEELPEYRSHLGAWRHLWSEGGLERAVTARLGPALPIGAAQDGDLCLMRWYASRPVGIRLGELILAPDQHGLARVPLDRGICCWSI